MRTILEDLRASYTVQRGGPYNRVRYYRGALRRRSDDGVIWECSHEHESPSAWSISAAPCAQQELRRRIKQAAGPAERRGRREGAG